MKYEIRDTRYETKTEASDPRFFRLSYFVSRLYL
jgi:hypothetical protein